MKSDNNMTVYTLMSDRILRNKMILLSTPSFSPSLLLVTTVTSSNFQKIKRLQAILDEDSRMIFRVVDEYEIQLDSQFVIHNAIRGEEYSKYNREMPSTYIGVLLNEATTGTRHSINPDNRIVYTVQQRSASLTTQSVDFVREYVI